MASADSRQLVNAQRERRNNVGGIASDAFTACGRIIASDHKTSQTHRSQAKGMESARQVPDLWRGFRRRSPMQPLHRTTSRVYARVYAPTSSEVEDERGYWGNVPGLRQDGCL